MEISIGVLQSLQDEKILFNVISTLYIVFGVLVLIMLQFISAPYGRYASDSSGLWGFPVNAKLAWFVQELPSLLLPMYVILFSDCPRLKSTPNQILIALFLLHYAQRSLIFPLLIKGGKPTPFITFLMAFLFCTVNGYLQVGFLAKYKDFDSGWLSVRFCFGVVLFLCGLVINIQADSILRNLRKPGETGYKIPQGGMFEYVSGANFFGEIMEWLGFAIASWSFPAFAFSFFTICNIGPRAHHHHRWYQKKFENYPRNRKALIPLLL